MKKKYFTKKYFANVIKLSDLRSTSTQYLFWKTNKKIQIHYRNVNTYMKTKSYMRYHRYDKNNVKYIKRFELNDVVPTIAEPGFTEWIRGTGPHSETALINVAEGVRRACLGVPKTAEQKEKMRQAKLGVPKSQEHKDNMRKSWYRRKELAERYIVDEIQSSSITSTI